MRSFAVGTGEKPSVDRLRFGMKAMRYADIPSVEALERSVLEVARANSIRANAHYRMIARFGRFPHRNPILGRASTPDELQYLGQPGAGF